MSEHDWLAERFEENRPHLRTVAYRMLGSSAEADDAVQETWLRLSRAGAGGVENLGGWLTTIVARVALNMLRSRTLRREEPMDPPAGGQPVAPPPDGTDPEHEAVLADSVGLALLVVLDTLTPAERLAFVLHDMFGVPFEEIASILDRSPDAARQLASRGRRRVRGAAPVPDTDLAQQREVVAAFLAAARAGDFEALVEVLDPDAVFRVDAGGLGPRAREPVTGAAAVAETVLARGRRFAPEARPALVNGTAGLIVGPEHAPRAVLGFTVVGGRIVELDLILDRKKLRRV